jgi:hypothetical protein
MVGEHENVLHTSRLHLDARASPSKSKTHAWRPGHEISTFNSKVNRVVEIFLKATYINILCL